MSDAAERAPSAHQPVMTDEAVELLAVRPGGCWCDGTLGGGGHAERILDRASPGGRLVGIDRDPDAIARARARLARFGARATLVQGDFADAPAILRACGVPGVDGLLLDLGLSSDQLSDPARGFSFSPGPLDMRMDPTRGEPLAALLARWDADRLAEVLREYGEERHARRVARAILAARGRGRLRDTGDLAAVAGGAAGGRRGRIHPATRTFQALRIAVNDEIGSLARLLSALPEPLSPGGRIVVIAFHSIEDRLVKHRLRELARPAGAAPAALDLCARKALRPSDAEVARNPRARSARLRAAVRRAAARPGRPRRDPLARRRAAAARARRPPATFRRP